MCGDLVSLRGGHASRTVHKANDKAKPPCKQDQLNGREYDERNQRLASGRVAVVALVVSALGPGYADDDRGDEACWGECMYDLM